MAGATENEERAFEHVGVVGGGAWGTALAQSCRRAGRKVTLWAFEPETAAEINSHHTNRVYLPGVALDPRIEATASVRDLAAAGLTSSWRRRVRPLRRPRARAPCRGGNAGGHLRQGLRAAHGRVHEFGSAGRLAAGERRRAFRAELRERGRKEPAGRAHARLRREGGRREAMECSLTAISGSIGRATSSVRRLAAR